MYGFAQGTTMHIFWSDRPNYFSSIFPLTCFPKVWQDCNWCKDQSKSEETHRGLTLVLICHVDDSLPVTTCSSRLPKKCLVNIQKQNQKMQILWSEQKIQTNFIHKGRVTQARAMTRDQCDHWKSIHIHTNRFRRRKMYTAMQKTVNFFPRLC